MNAAGRLVIATVVGSAGMWMLLTAVAQRTPSLTKMSAHLARRPVTQADGPAVGWSRLGLPLARRLRLSSLAEADLRLVRRPLEVHAAYMMAAAAAGLFGPALVVVVCQTAGVVSLGVMVPLGLSVVCAVIAPLVVHSTMSLPRWLWMSKKRMPVALHEYSRVSPAFIWRLISSKVCGSTVVRLRDTSKVAG